MNGLLGMGLVGWAVSLVIGFVLGGIFFLSIKVEVDYVVKQRGPTWLLPALLYARLAFVAAVLIVVAGNVPREQLPAAMIAGLVGAIVARVLVSRLVRRPPDTPESDATDGDDRTEDD